MIWHMPSTDASSTPERVAANGDERTPSTPPYVSWTTVLNAIERMASEGETPSRLDRSYLRNMPGSTQAQFRHACRWLGFVNPDDDTPTPTLKALVADADGRPELVGRLVHQRYPGPLSLPKNATQQQLEEAFREMGATTGETLRKNVAFFLNACKYAGIELSPQFSQPRVPRGTNGSRTRKARRKGNETAVQDQPSGSSGTGDAPNIIRDLLTKLPAEGSKWQREKVEQWLGIAKLTFEMVYELDGEYSDSKDSGSP
jgi:hypothetical protein